MALFFLLTLYIQYYIIYIKKEKTLIVAVLHHVLEDYLIMHMAILGDMYDKEVVPMSIWIISDSH